MTDFKIIEGGSVTTPKGFKASGITAGLKQSGSRDMAAIFSEVPANAAGSFTSSLFAAAPVVLDKEHLAGGVCRAVIINSGNANACTGEQGYKDAVRMAEVTGAELGIPKEVVLVSSTGRIGTPMPMGIIENGIIKAVKALSDDGGHDAAEAIMTTDTVPKECCVSVDIDGKTVTIGGMVKGAGMIDPNLTVPHATMLGYITTDAAVEQGFLNSLLKNGVESSFNRITVDGDMSTNDTVLLLANGIAENSPLNENHSEAEQFRKALFYVLEQLAKAIVLDAEGGTKFVTVKVENAKSAEDAKLCAEAIANSMLCKTAWFGGDPNWGRILAAAGYSGAGFPPNKVNLFYDDKPVVVNGEDAGTSEKELEKVLQKDSFSVIVDLKCGDTSYEVWTNDISYEYVKINAEYHT